MHAKVLCMLHGTSAAVVHTSAAVYDTPYHTESASAYGSNASLLRGSTTNCYRPG
jgi:hypothetical protein